MSYKKQSKRHAKQVKRRKEKSKEIAKNRQLNKSKFTQSPEYLKKELERYERMEATFQERMKQKFSDFTIENIDDQIEFITDMVLPDLPPELEHTRINYLTTLNQLQMIKNKDLNWLKEFNDYVDTNVAEEERDRPMEEIKEEVLKRLEDSKRPFQHPEQLFTNLQAKFADDDFSDFIRDYYRFIYFNILDVIAIVVSNVNRMIVSKDDAFIESIRRYKKPEGYILPVPRELEDIEEEEPLTEAQLLQIINEQNTSQPEIPQDLPSKHIVTDLK